MKNNFLKKSFKLDEWGEGNAQHMFFRRQTQGSQNDWLRQDPVKTRLLTHGVETRSPTVREWQATAAPSLASSATLNCVTCVDESAQCCSDRGGALRCARRWNAPIEENADGQPSSAARRPVPRHGMSSKGKQPQWKSGWRKGKERRVSYILKS